MNSKEVLDNFMKIRASLYSSHNVKRLLKYQYDNLLKDLNRLEELEEQIAALDLDVPREENKKLKKVIELLKEVLENEEKI